MVHVLAVQLLVILLLGVVDVKPVFGVLWILKIFFIDRLNCGSEHIYSSSLVFVT